MNIYWLSISAAIFSNIFYHLSMKFTSPLIHPLAALTLSYLTATIICFVILVCFSPGPLSSHAKDLNWAPFALGASICLLEVGFLLAYRAGWSLSVAALFCNVAVGLILLPVGLAFFKERLTALNFLGIFLALAGLILIGKK